MAADVSWDSPNKRIWRALADPVGQPVRRHHKFLNRFVIFQFDFQDNPLKNAAVSIVIGRECYRFTKDKLTLSFARLLCKAKNDANGGAESLPDLMQPVEIELDLHLISL